MVALDILKKKVDDLESLAQEIEDLGMRLLQESRLHRDEDGDYYWAELKGDLKAVQRDATRKYQRWYTSAYLLIKEYIPEKEEEFVRCYENKNLPSGVIDILYLRSARLLNISRHVTNYFLNNLGIQRSILLSVPDVAEIKELNLRKIISADLARTEIEQAEILLVHGFERAAGSIAGVALELHLKTLCDLKGVSYKAKDTIDSLVTALYKADKIDITELKHVQYLASIRNKCSHPETVTQKEVEKLVDEVRKIL